MKKLEFAKVQEGENKLAIEVSNDSPVVAVISQNGMLECILVNDSFPEVLSDICGHISSELGVAAVTVDTDQYGDDVRRRKEEQRDIESPYHRTEYCG